MIKKYTLYKLTKNSVSVLVQKFTEDTQEQVGKNFRKTYTNNAEGKAEIKKELPSPEKDAVFVMWR